MLLLCLVVLLVRGSYSSNKPDVMLNITSNITVMPNLSFNLQEMLMKTPGEYLEQGTIIVNFTLSQFTPIQSFDLLVFDLND